MRGKYKSISRTKKIHDENCLPVPYNVNIANAIEGFHDMGFEIHCYEKLSEAYNLYQQGDIVLDGILQVNHCLNKFGIIQMFYRNILEERYGLIRLTI